MCIDDILNTTFICVRKIRINGFLFHISKKYLIYKNEYEDNSYTIRLEGYPISTGCNVNEFQVNVILNAKEAILLPDFEYRKNKISNLLKAKK